MGIVEDGIVAPRFSVGRLAHAASVWCAVLVSGCASLGMSSDSAGPTEEEYEVYAAVLWEVFTGPYQQLQGPRVDTIPTGTYVLTPREPSLVMMDSMLLVAGDVDPGAARHYLEVNGGRFALEPRVPGIKNQIILSRSEADEVFTEDGWDEFYRRYPDAVALVGLSRVGFSTDRQSALVFVSRYQGALSGEFGVVYLYRGVDGWTVVGWPLGKAISE